MRVLICDDEADVRMLYRHAFESHGVDVSEASDGNECVAAATLTQPDLIILDLFMPERDGLSVLPDLVRLAPDSRVVIVTAHAAVDVFEHARAHGATTCLDKLGFLPRVPQLIERYGRGTLRVTRS